MAKYTHFCSYGEVWIKGTDKYCDINKQTCDGCMYRCYDKDEYRRKKKLNEEETKQ